MKPATRANPHPEPENSVGEAGTNDAGCVNLRKHLSGLHNNNAEPFSRKYLLGRRGKTVAQLSERVSSRRKSRIKNRERQPRRYSGRFRIQSWSPESYRRLHQLHSQADSRMWRWQQTWRCSPAHDGVYSLLKRGKRGTVAILIFQSPGTVQAKKSSFPTLTIWG